MTGDQDQDGRVGGPARSCRRGFSLVEMILVLVVIGIVAAVTLPTLARSIRGSRLRTATRSIVMAGRYARSMAVMKQSQMEVRFDLDAEKITVATAGYVPPSSDDEGDKGLSSDGGVDAEGSRGGAAAVMNAERVNVPPPAAGKEELRLVLERIDVKSVEMEGEGEARFDKGICAVIYNSNGTCSPYRVELLDEQGAGVVIEVDSLATAETEAKTK